ncbi:hypothetical protein NITLEN_10257 [Nitrospira lenta]|uniref:Uncharacterized protein n=1 Tax=Nitrospira lenta TaxID=1436998 RepID=A0A330L051_9BACT|nr:hypothetical protein NITLEN_10257 [Nitrospira lenta]
MRTNQTGRSWGALRSGSLERGGLPEAAEPEDSMPDTRRSAKPGPAEDNERDGCSESGMGTTTLLASLYEALSPL